MQPIYCFANAFSADETAGFIARAEGDGFEPTGNHYPASYRNNDRLVVDDEAMADRVLAKLRGHVPEHIVDRDGVRWRLRGLNPRFRFCRYRDGQSFSVHRDGVYHAGARARSQLTFMIYLNDAAEFSGGDTRFFDGRDRRLTTLTVTPRRGTLIVFDHSLWHEGAAVVRGTKYVMRSDVIYERADTDENANDDDDGHRGYVWQLARLRDGRIASGGRDTTIRLWRVDDDLIHDRVLRGHTCSVSALAAIGDGMWSGSRDGTICRWREHQLQSSRRGHDGAVLSIAGLSDGRVATSSADGTIKLWRRDGTLDALLRAGGQWVWQLAERNDGMLIAAGEDGMVELWSPTSLSRVDQLALGEPARCVAVTDDWGIIAGGSAGTLCAWYGNEIRARYKAHDGAVRAIAQISGGLLTAGEDDMARRWDHGFRPVDSVRHDDFVTAIACLDRHRFVTASYDGAVRLWPPQPATIAP